MSFAAEVRKELCQIENTPECRHAEAYGLLLFSHVFSAHEIVLQTESEAVATRLATLLAEETGIFPEIRLPLKRRGGRITSVCVGAGQCGAVLEAFGHSASEPALHIRTENLQGADALAAFLRGVFLSCGTISDPTKQYHAEMDVPRRLLFADLAERTADLPITVHFGQSARKNTHVLYCKASEEITDFLTYLGAPQCAMQLMQVKMVKEVRNTANRLRNLDTANIDKTVSASANQIAAIRSLKKSGKLADLPPQLQELAELRAENPEMSLRELGEMLTEPLSRSGVNHRLERLIQLAKDEK